jgi:hypothetical protein
MSDLETFSPVGGIRSKINTDGLDVSSVGDTPKFTQTYHNGFTRVQPLVTEDNMK